MVAANRTLPIMAGETIRAAQRDVSHGVFGVQTSVTEPKWLRVGTRTKLSAQVIKNMHGADVRSVKRRVLMIMTER